MKTPLSFQLPRKLNIKPLTERLFKALGEEGSAKTELIFVDDNSKDGSVEEVEALQKRGYNVKIIVRTTERGLSSAVLKVSTNLRVNT